LKAVCFVDVLTLGDGDDPPFAEARERPLVGNPSHPCRKTPRQAEAVSRVRTTNRRLVRELSSKRELFSSYPAKLALLSNPHTPLSAGLEYLAQARQEDHAAESEPRYQPGDPHLLEIPCVRRPG